MKESSILGVAAWRSARYGSNERGVVEWDVFPEATCGDDLLKGEARAGYGCGCDGGFAHEKEAEEELGPRGVSGVGAQLGLCGSDLVSRRGLEDRSGSLSFRLLCGMPR